MISISSVFIFEYGDDVCVLSNVIDISYNVSQCGIIITDLLWSSGDTTGIQMDISVISAIHVADRSPP